MGSEVGSTVGDVEGIELGAVLGAVVGALVNSQIIDTLYRPSTLSWLDPICTVYSPAAIPNKTISALPTASPHPSSSNATISPAPSMSVNVLLKSVKASHERMATESIFPGKSTVKKAMAPPEIESVLESPHNKLPGVMVGNGVGESVG